MDLFSGAMPAILADFRDLKMEEVDSSYAAVIVARRHQRTFDKFLAEPFLDAVAHGAAECYQANRARIESLDLDEQSRQRRELRRRWLVVVIKLTPRALEAFVRQAEFERSMELTAMEAITSSRTPPPVLAATASQSSADERSVAGPSNSAKTDNSVEPASAPGASDDTEELVRAALTLDDPASVEKALAELWGPGWSKNACAREADVDRGTVRNLIRKEKIRASKWAKIIDAFKKRRRR